MDRRTIGRWHGSYAWIRQDTPRWRNGRPPTRTRSTPPPPSCARSSSRGYYAVVSTGEGHAEQVHDAAAGRRPRDPPPPDRRRVSAASLPGARVGLLARADDAARGCGSYAPLVDDRRRSSRCVPMVARPAVLLLFDPPGDGGRRRDPAGPRVGDPGALREPRREGGQAARADGRRPRRRPRSGLLGDLVGHDARELHARTGLVMERGALGVWLVGEAGALLVRGAPRALLVRARARAVAAVVGPDRAPAARAARGRGGLRHRGQPRVRGRALARAPPTPACAAPGLGRRPPPDSTDVDSRRPGERFSARAM